MPRKTHPQGNVPHKTLEQRLRVAKRHAVRRGFNEHNASVWKARRENGRAL